MYTSPELTLRFAADRRATFQRQADVHRLFAALRRRRNGDEAPSGATAWNVVGLPPPRAHGDATHGRRVA